MIDGRLQTNSHPLWTPCAPSQTSDCEAFARPARIPFTLFVAFLSDHVVNQNDGGVMSVNEPFGGADMS